MSDDIHDPHHGDNWAGWVLLARDSVPEPWRSRSTPLSLVAITPDEAASFLHGQAFRPTLRPEEEQMLSLLLAGDSIKVIARTLETSPRSVQRRLAALRKAFRASSNTDLAVIAARAGFR